MRQKKEEGGVVALLKMMLESAKSGLVPKKRGTANKKNNETISVKKKNTHTK